MTGSSIGISLALAVPIWTWLAVTAFVDILIAISMSILLYRIESCIESTARVRTKLVHYAITSGAVTASVAVVALATYVFEFTQSRETMDYVSCCMESSYAVSNCPILVLSKLYANTALIGFNNRMLLRGGHDNKNQSTGIEFANLDVPSDPYTSEALIPASEHSCRQHHLVVNVHQEVMQTPLTGSSLETLPTEEQKTDILSSSDAAEVEIFPHAICIDISKTGMEETGITQDTRRQVQDTDIIQGIADHSLAGAQVQKPLS